MPAPALFAVIVTAVLLVAVAIFLVVVVVLLHRIVRALSAIDAKVATVADRAGPLDGLFESLNEQLSATADQLQAAGAGAGDQR